jgi:hypothetical protein
MRPMRVVAYVGNLLLVCLFVAASYLVIRAVRDGQVERARRSDHRPLMLGPTGIGKLRLGMSPQEAAATGEAAMSKDSAKYSTKCSVQDAYGVTIYFSRDHGIVGLAGPPERTRTPEGIGSGATVGDIITTYPTLNNPELGSPQEQVKLFGGFSAPVPGNPNAVYHFVFFEFEFTIDGSTTRPATHGTTSDRSKLKYVLLAQRGQDEDCLTIS